MEFDHARGEKQFEISQGEKFSWTDVRLEIDKCDLVCANCHRVRTQLRKNMALERNNQLQPVEPSEVHPNPAPTSPFNYSIDEEVEREKAMDRANDKVPNLPQRPIL